MSHPVRKNIYGGWHWPAHDKWAFDAITDEAAMIPKVWRLMRALTKSGPRTILQAGGNAGMFPVLLSDEATLVYSFEPDWDNYSAMVENISLHRANVIPIFGALMDRSGPVAMDWSGLPENIGAGFVRFNSRSRVPAYKLDHSFAELRPSLVWLDIEGAELCAIQGGMNRVLSERPLLILEMKGHASRFGHSDAEVDQYLVYAGWRFIAGFGNDRVYVHAKHEPMARDVWARTT
jgi:FkbM family methyltransferase